MFNKFGYFLAFLVILISSLSFADSQIDHDSTNIKHDSSKDFSELLKDEDKSEFFTNLESGDFQTIFVKKATMNPSNNILIKSGTTVKLTGSIEREFSTILVEGNLKIIDTGDSSFHVQKIIVAPSGSLTIGNNENPIQSDKQVEIVFEKSNEGEIGIFVFGTLWIHGQEISPTFVELESFARKWDKSLVVESELINWKRGDAVVITSPGIENCNETHNISKIVNQQVTLMNVLSCSHRVITDTENSIKSHVALLSRNVKISSDDIFDRGSVNFFHGSNGYIKYAQFDLLGPKEVLGRYPIHFHHLKDSSIGIEVIGNSITNSDNRWITIHDSNGIIVRENVGFISQGHGFFLEDGTEFNNVFEKNIGIITKQELIRNVGGSSVFWTANPMNVYRDNVAVSAQYWGFFFEIPDKEVNLPNSDKQINLRSIPSLEFEDNTAYNNRHGGAKILRHTVQEETSPIPEIIISNFQNMGTLNDVETHIGILITGSDVSISNSKIFNQKIGIKMGGSSNKVLDTEIKMERNGIPDADITGILISGRNHLIEDSKIEGYVSRYNHEASDISIYNNEQNKRLISAKIVNTTLLDPKPFKFGNTGNENSFLEVYGYDAPQTQSKKLPENFLLKSIGSDTIEQRGEYNDLDFDAMIKIIPKTNSDNTSKINDELINSEIIKNFKNKGLVWGKTSVTDKEFLNEIEVLFESGLIEIKGVEQGSFQEHEFIIPKWIEKLVDFWFKNSISDQEFMNAIKYVLESSMEKDSLYGDKN